MAARNAFRPRSHSTRNPLGVARVERVTRESGSGYAGRFASTERGGIPGFATLHPGYTLFGLNSVFSVFSVAIFSP